MQQSLKQRTVTGTRQLNSAERAGAYGIPRYRVTLVCEETGGETASAIHDSSTAASLLCPHFAGLDRDHFVVVGLDAKHGVIAASILCRSVPYLWQSYILVRCLRLLS